MRVVAYENGRLEVRYMWLPVFIGQNMALMRELEIAGAAKFQGCEMSEGLLDEVHEWVIGWLKNRFPIPGLSEYLAGISHVNMEEQNVPVQQAAGR